LDIDLILSEEERLPCTFQVDASNMGHLDVTVQSDTLPSGARVELPHWLGQPLFEKNVVVMEVPKHFGPKMRDHMFAGASNVNLRSYSHYFFEIGLRLAKVMRDEDLFRKLRVAFLGERYRKLVVRALSQSPQDDVAEFCQALTSTELVIFHAGYQASQNLQRWRANDSALLDMAPILRRRAASSSSSGDGGGGGKRQRV